MSGGRTNTKMIEGRRKWVCAATCHGYHQGWDCTSSNPHGGYWGCGWYYVGLEKAES